MIWVLIHMTVAALVSAVAALVIEAWDDDEFLEPFELACLSVVLGLLWPITLPGALFYLVVVVLRRAIEGPVRGLIEYVLKNR